MLYRGCLQSEEMTHGIFVKEENKTKQETTPSYVSLERDEMLYLWPSGPLLTEPSSMSPLAGHVFHIKVLN